MVKSVRLWARYLSAVTLAMLVAGGASSAGPATSPTTSPALTVHDLALLHQLETGSWRERKAAEAELSARPVEDEPIIRQMLADTKSAEAENRLNAVLQHMKDMGIVGATLITMSMKDAPAKAVYAELFKQAGGALKTRPANLLDDPTLPRLSIDVDHQPFWTVIEKLQSASKLTVAPEPDALGGCCLARGGPIAGPHQVSGPFLILLSGPPAHFGTNGFPAIAMRVYPEPKLHVVLGVDVKLIRAVDDNGNVLEEAPQMPPMFMTGFQSLAIVRFKKPAKNPGRHLVQYAAMVTPQVEIQFEHLDIPDLVKAAPQTIQVGGLAVTFKGCRQIGGNYQVTFSTGLDPQMRMTQVFRNPHSRIHVLDASGHELTQLGTGFSGGGTAGSVFTFIYAPQPEPSRLICDIPTDIRSIDDPVDFKDLNLLLGGL